MKVKSSNKSMINMLEINTERKAFTVWVKIARSFRMLKKQCVQSTYIVMSAIPKPN